MFIYSSNSNIEAVNYLVQQERNSKFAWGKYTSLREALVGNREIGF